MGWEMRCLRRRDIGSCDVGCVVMTREGDDSDDIPEPPEKALDSRVRGLSRMRITEASRLTGEHPCVETGS